MRAQARAESSEPEIGRLVRTLRARGNTPTATLIAVSCGGVIGAVSRYALVLAVPHGVGGFPWSTFLVNVTGCFLIGVLMVLVTERYRPHPLVRLFLGVGVLGGFTTFSTYAVEAQRLITAGAARTGLLYLVGTPAVALTAVWLGLAVTRYVTSTPAPRPTAAREPVAGRVGSW